MESSIRTSTARQVRSRTRARRTAVVAAVALASLALAPGAAHARQLAADGGGGGGAPGADATTRHTVDIDDAVWTRKQQMVHHTAPVAPRRAVSTVRYVFAVRAGCDIPQSLDAWSRRLIAVQVCARARLVPAARARVGYVELATEEVGHCGHQALHQPPTTAGLPVYTWFTPTSC